MTQVITFSNFKGGSGKTTNACMSAYVLARRGFKVLMIDMDPQANATSMFSRTYFNSHQHSPVFKYYLHDGLQAGNFRKSVFPITENLSLIPTTVRFSRYERFMRKMFPQQDEYKQARYFKRVLESVKHEYDFVIIDVPPTMSAITDSALYASDFTVVVLQTQNFAFDGAQVMIDYMEEMTTDFKANLEVLGILCVIFNNSSILDPQIIEMAKESFGEENLFETKIRSSERIKRYGGEGVWELDFHDRKVMKLYDELVDEMLERIEVLVR